MTTQRSVTLDNIKKSYDGKVEVIKGVDLAIAPGEFLVLVGPSGCGKSTLLRMIAGLEEITSGDLHIGERRVNDLPPRDRGIGMVFQSYALYPHMTVRENMGFGLKIRKIKPEEIEERVLAVSQMLDLEHLLDRLPKNLSGGQRQRVAMGRAIVREPDVFLFDEPLSNLDAALRTQMRVELKKLHKKLGATMIYVTHDQIEAMTLADRIMILNAGVVQQVGSPTEIFEHPANRFVASFIGSPSMNFLERDALTTLARQGAVHIPDACWHEQSVTLGIRPQHMEIARTRDELPDDALWLEIEIDVIEPMGWEAYLHGIHGEELKITAHVTMEQLTNTSSGDTIYLYASPRHIRHFDLEGKALR